MDSLSNEASSSSSARQSSLESSGTTASHNTMASISGSSTNRTTSSSQTNSSIESGRVHHRRHQYRHGHGSKNSGSSHIRRGVPGDFLSSDDSSQMSVQSQTSLEARERSFGSPSDLPGTLDMIPDSNLSTVSSEIALHYLHGYNQQQIISGSTSLSTNQRLIPGAEMTSQACICDCNIKHIKGTVNVGCGHSLAACVSSNTQRRRQDAFAAARHQHQQSCSVTGNENRQTSQSTNQLLPAPKRLGPYDFIRIIGKGNFAVVKLAIHRSIKSFVAIKVMNKELLGKQNLEKVYREIAAMKGLHHPYIVQLYQVIETDSKIFMVLEYAAKGEVFDIISNSHAFSEREARELFWQCVCAVHFCHKSGVVHRDLKAENLLLDEHGHIKVADFGFCNFYQSGSLLSTHCGSPQYAAPELFKGELYDGTLADVWSLGVILYIFVCGSFPFPGDSLGDIRRQVLRGLVRFPFFLSRSCEQVIRVMLQVDPKKRYRLEQVIEMPWMLESSNVEQYKDLLRRQSRVAQERRFEELFRTHHPEHCAIREDDATASLSKINSAEILSSVTWNSLSLESQTMLMNCLFTTLTGMGFEEEQMRLALREGAFDYDYAIFCLLREKVMRFLSKKMSWSFRTIANFNSIDCELLSNIDSLMNFIRLVLRVDESVSSNVLQPLKESDEIPISSGDTYSHNEKASTHHPSRLTHSGAGPNGHCLQREIESLDETTSFMSHHPYTYFFPMEGPAANPGDVDAHNVPLTSEDEALFHSALQDQSLRRHTIQLESSRGKSTLAMWRIVPGSGIAAGPDIISRPESRLPTPTWVLEDHGDGDQPLVRPVEEYEYTSASSLCGGQMHSWIPGSETIPMMATIEEHSVSITSSGEENTAVPSITPLGSEEVACGPIQPNSPAGSLQTSPGADGTNSNQWCLLRCLPHLNLPANVPVMQHQSVARFTVKDPNLLAPPDFMTPYSSCFPRRSSDGAAELQPLHRPYPGLGGSYPEHSSSVKQREMSCSGFPGGVGSRGGNINEGRPPLEALLCCLQPPSSRELYQKRFSLPYSSLSRPGLQLGSSGQYHKSVSNNSFINSSSTTTSTSNCQQTLTGNVKGSVRRGSEDSQMTVWSQRVNRSCIAGVSNYSGLSGTRNHHPYERSGELCINSGGNTAIGITSGETENVRRLAISVTSTSDAPVVTQSAHLSPPAITSTTPGRLDLQELKNELRILSRQSVNSNQTLDESQHASCRSPLMSVHAIHNDCFLTRPPQLELPLTPPSENPESQNIVRVRPAPNTMTNNGPDAQLHRDFLNSPKRQSYFDWFPRMLDSTSTSLSPQSAYQRSNSSTTDSVADQLYASLLPPASAHSTTLYHSLYHNPAQRDEDEADLLAIERVNEKLRRGQLEFSHLFHGVHSTPDNKERGENSNDVLK